ncbi:MAG: DUF692 family protein [Anaerolineales bacterium]|nr:DUF692 family protein [Anaerolineales bacterium]
MLFAINYSNQAAALLAQGQIQIDRFKTPNWPEMVAEAQRQQRVAVHFNLKAGRGEAQRADWQAIDDALQRTGTPFVNLHLEARMEDLPCAPMAGDDLACREGVIQRMVADLRAAVERFGAGQVIAENVPYRSPAGQVLRACVEPGVIRRALDETGCGLLLDIAHARISASSLGMDEREYMSALPVERLRELHFSGVGVLDGWPQDHLAAQEADWAALEWALARIQVGEWACPWMLAFEYGGVGEKFAWRSDQEVIAAQAPRVYELVKSI